ncbi:hypothetical protein OQJ26_03220 [Legionella sp. PATHC038]|uniref:hypothetical protein n=1 Tax=Legionella sheltonii TaxID=2992041 RepID=UPI002243DE11|nr:hypothetical protein [Legionella sp. PATHC038]MCW8397798.1 hypothetical protein [Legionella sp. PATHC038]
MHYARTDQSVDGDCVRETMTDLGWWIDDKPNMRIPALADAMWIVDPDYARKLEAELDPHLVKPDSYKMMMRGALGGESAEPKPLPKKIPPSELLALDPAVKERLQKMMDNKSSIKEPETPLQPIKTSDLKQEVSISTPLTI